MAAEGFPNNYVTIKLPSGLQYTCVHFPKPSTCAGKAPVVLLHGFPSSSYDFQHQIRYFASQGHSVIAPDLLGYGGSNSPDSLEPYSLKRMSQDLMAILDYCGVNIPSGEKVHLVAHDFGCYLLSVFAGYFPRVAITCSFLAVPYSPPGRKMNLDVMKELTERELGYEFFGYRRFLIRDDSWEIIDAHKESFFTILYGSEEDWVKHFLPAGRLEAWLKADRKAPLSDYINPEYKATRDSIFGRGKSYRGPTDWYRARFRDYVDIDEELKDLGEDVRLPCPTLFMQSEGSEILAKELVERTKKFSDVYEYAEIKGGKTHWVQLEAPSEVNRVLEEFFDKYSS